METGRLLVDGIDAYLEYGVYITAGGWCQLAAWPSLKKVDTNDWQEEDGVEADLESPVLDTRDITVTFASHGEWARPFSFIAALMDGAYHEFNCAYLGRTYNLRLVSHPKLDYARELSTFSLKLADDFPLDGYDYAEPESGMKALGEYFLDDRDLSEYGVRVLSGSLANVLKQPDVKTAMLRNIATVAGAIYDDVANVVLKTKDVKLTCLMRAGSVEEMWRNWDALLYDLARPDERLLYVSAVEQEFPCYYKSCSVSELNPEACWLKFSLTLTFTRDFAIDESEAVLESESGIIVFTEDGENAIDMSNAFGTRG